ncbi:MAG: ROK family protein, partial [Bacteroidales bacterium]|nr:ROK family protein [Bacteroidales bacterium]
MFSACWNNIWKRNKSWKYKLNNIMEYAIGIDIGGTNTDIGLVNEKGQCVARKNLPTAQYKEVEKYVDDIADVIRH